MSAGTITGIAWWAVLLLAGLPAWAALRGRERRQRARELLAGPARRQGAASGSEGGLRARATAVLRAGAQEWPAERRMSVRGGGRPEAPGPASSGADRAVRKGGYAGFGGASGDPGGGPLEQGRPSDGAVGRGGEGLRQSAARGPGAAPGWFAAGAVRVAGRRIGGEWGCVPLGVGLGVATWSVVPVIAGAVAVPLVRGALRRRAERGVAERTSAAVSALCGTVAGDLRAGRPPHVALADAVESGGWPGSPELAETARLVLSAARFGGDVPRALRSAAEQAPGAQGLAAVAACWQVAVDGGAGLAAALDRVAAALRAEADQRDDLRAQLAGPRSTAVLLALLPGFGLVLGTGLGADPSAVLLHTPAGLVCLVTGALLEWAGLAWTARIIRGAEGGPPGAGRVRPAAGQAARAGGRS